MCYDNFATQMNQPITRVEQPFCGKSLPGYLHLPQEPKPGEKFPCAIAQSENRTRVRTFRTVRMQVRKISGMPREFAAATWRRNIKAESFATQNQTVAARESYLIAAMLCSAARWPIFENNEKSIDYNLLGEWFNSAKIG